MGLVKATNTFDKYTHKPASYVGQKVTESAGWFPGMLAGATVGLLTAPATIVSGLTSVTTRGVTQLTGNAKDDSERLHESDIAETIGNLAAFTGVGAIPEATAAIATSQMVGAYGEAKRKIQEKQTSRNMRR